MNAERKGQSPFYPGQPVPVDLFVGRAEEVERISRAAMQVAAGKPQAIFISGEYGIGKSSLARYVRVFAEDDPGLLGFHVMLGGANSLEDLATTTVQTVASATAMKPKATERIREILADYIGEQSLFGVKLHLEKLRRDAPDISAGYLPFLRNVYERIKDNYTGLMLILDEINGMAGKASFSRFLKGLVDENALSDMSLPLLLVLCGTGERHREMIEHHRPVERIFEVAHIKPMTDAEMREFFERAFAQVGMRVEEPAMQVFCRYSGGLPKLMHLVGDAAFWIAPANAVDKDVTISAILAAAEDVGRKFIDQQVYRALRSKDYHSILAKLARHDFDLIFKKSKVEQGLSSEERRKFNNFLQRMKKLKVLAPGEERGEYAFRDRLTRLYLMLEAVTRNE